MSRKYKFRNPEAIYFVSFATVNWIDVFTRPEYKNIVVDSLNHCIKNKGLVVYANYEQPCPFSHRTKECDIGRCHTGFEKIYFEGYPESDRR